LASGNTPLSVKDVRESELEFHLRMISERYRSESTVRDRLIAHFVKGVFDWCLINAYRTSSSASCLGGGKALHGLVEP